MTARRKSPRYIVANPRGLPAGKWIFRQGERRYYEGDAYDGTEPDEPLRRGFLVEVTDGKA